MCFSLFSLELQSGAARGFGQRLDSTVVGEAAAIEDDRLDARLAGALGDGLADGGGALCARGRLERLAKVGVGARGGRQRPARGVVDYLRVNVMQAAEDRQPRPIRTTLEVAAQPAVPANPRRATIRNFVHYFAAPAPVFPVLPALRRIRSPR